MRAPAAHERWPQASYSAAPLPATIGWLWERLKGAHAAHAQGGRMGRAAARGQVGARTPPARPALPPLPAVPCRRVKTGAPSARPTPRSGRPPRYPAWLSPSGETDALHQARGGVVFDARGDDAHLDAGRAQRLALDIEQWIVGGDGQMAQMERPQQLDVIVRVHTLAADDEDAVHHTQRRHQLRAVVLRLDGAVRALPAAHALVALDADGQRIAELSCRLQEPEVPHVEQIEDPGDDDQPARAQPRLVFVHARHPALRSPCVRSTL